LAIFISYSHADAAFVEKLSMALVEHNVHVLIDKWELNVGDSILNWVQKSIQESGALLVVLSKTSVASAWCNKELNAGLMRELNEKRVLVLPVLVDDCDIPIFLREKVYADFRTDFDAGLKSLVEALAKVSNVEQGRMKIGGTTTDWAETWTYRDELFWIEYTLIEFSPDMPFTLLTMIAAECNDVVTRRYRKYQEAGLGWMGRIIIAETITELADKHDIKVRLEDQRPVVENFGIRDPKVGAEYYIQIRCQRLGEDNGRDQLVNISNYLREIREHVRKLVRPMTDEEKAVVQRIKSSPW